MNAVATPAAFDCPCADALELLSRGHEHTRALADECRRVARHRPSDAGMRELAEALCRATHRMAALEEELFFPAARAAGQAAQLVDLAELEHATARQIVRQLQAADPCGARYQALVLALVDCVERHARHEQERLFPTLRASGLDLQALEQPLHERLARQDEAVLQGEEDTARRLGAGADGVPSYIGWAHALPRLPYPP